MQVLQYSLTRLVREAQRRPVDYKVCLAACARACGALTATRSTHALRDRSRCCTTRHSWCSITLTAQSRTSRLARAAVAAVILPPLTVPHARATRRVQLAMITFQNMFPAINVTTVKLSECKRVVLVHYNKVRRATVLRCCACMPVLK